MEAQRIEAPLFERLTWQEICAKYPDEWVMMVEVEWRGEDTNEFGTALVIGHGRDSKMLHQQTKTLVQRYDESACFFTGDIKGPTPHLHISPP